MESADIKYAIAGFIDESGQVYFSDHAVDGDDVLAYKLNSTYTDLSANFDQSNLRPFGNFLSGAAPANIFSKGGDLNKGTVTGLLLNPNNTKDVMHADYANSNLKDLTVNDKLTFYHRNHATANTTISNTRFDAYEKKHYRYLIAAMLDQNDQSGTERKLAVLNINVREASTGFFIKPDKSAVFKTVETLGTLAEGLSAKQNNPEFAIREHLLDNIDHEDLTDAELYDKTKVKYSVAYIDPKLEICPPASDGAKEDLTFEQQVIKLRNIDANKTTETKTGGVSANLARYAHYNYERAKEYQIHICAELTNFEEIEVVKVSPNYVCGQFDNGLVSTAGKPKTGGKTASFIMKSQKINSEIQDDPRTIATGNDSAAHKRFYFKNPDTGLYEGPLSLSPQGMDDLTAFRKINGVKVKYAYVRYETKTGADDAKTSNFTPLYKSVDFKDNMTKPPKPADSCLLIFTLKVLNSYDSLKTSPQPYLLNEKSSYRYSDPKNQTDESVDLVTGLDIDPGSTKVCYVFGDHSELNTNNNMDNKNDATIPAWHPHNLNPTHTDYANGFNLRTVDASATTYAKNKLGDGIERKVHPKAKSGNKNTTQGGVWNGEADGSVRYGDFREISADKGVFLDFFVEHHGEIDASGWNEVDYDGIFGTAVDYSANQKTFE